VVLPRAAPGNLPHYLRGICDLPSFYLSLTTVTRGRILFFPRGVQSAVSDSLPKITQAITSHAYAQKRSSKVSTKHVKGTMKSETDSPQWKNHVQTENVARLEAIKLMHTVFC